MGQNLFFMGNHSEIARRKTFAIISHPDAGKTTLTEKLLLYGGAIKTAGAVKRNKLNQSGVSDFMEIERQRGISVATSVMAFDYKGKRINILDTPGHKDFAEDTYRTLSAVDSVILVVDSVKGVEEQTQNLMQVCRMRNTPVIIFINKVDREGKDFFDLLFEIEKTLKISLSPLTWPVGQGDSFKGVYNLLQQEINLFEFSKTMLPKLQTQLKELDHPSAFEYLPGDLIKRFQYERQLIDITCERFDLSLYQDGLLSPVFFGSAMHNIGVLELLDMFIDIAPSPGKQEAIERTVLAEEKALTGFVFKIHANLDPKHRDRIAFFRICSGKFERHQLYFHPRSGKKIRFKAPLDFMANDKTVIDIAWPGDVVGLYDSGNFKIGDSLTEGETLHFKGIPNFSPSIFKELVNEDAFKSKQLEKGIMQLAEEGVAQIFIRQHGSRKIIGTVGELQFEVISFRLTHEYGAKCSFRTVDLYKAAWVRAEEKIQLERFLKKHFDSTARDAEGRLVYLAGSNWELTSVIRDFPELKFYFNTEFENG